MRKKEYPSILYFIWNVNHIEQRTYIENFKRELQITYKGKHIRIKADYFSTGTVVGKDCRRLFFKPWKEVTFNEEILYPVKLSSRIQREIKVS